MRRLLALLLLLFCCFLPGCAEQKITQEELLLSFRCSAAVEYAGKTYECRVERQGLGVVTIRTPEIGYHWQGEFFSQTYAGLEAVSDVCPLPESCFAVQLNRYLDDLHRKGALSGVSSDSLEGSLEGKNYTILADPETGRLCELSVPQIGLTVRFFDYEA